MTFYERLIARGYTEADAEETLLRMENGLEMPEEVRRDIRELAAEERAEMLAKFKK